jgi:hypothetical protein
MTHQKDGDGKFSVVKAMTEKFWWLQDWWPNFFGCNMINNLNLFLFANHNECNPSMTHDFPTSILMNVTNASRWMLMWRSMQNRHIMLVLTTLLVVVDFWNGLKPKSTTWYSHFFLIEYDDNRWKEMFRMLKNALFDIAKELCAHLLK